MSNNILDWIKNNYKLSNVQANFHESLVFGILLAIVGGYLDAYTFIGRDGVFANAQTGNIVLIGLYASEGNWGQAFLHVPPILAFVLGVIVTEAIKMNVTIFKSMDWRRIILLLEIFILIIIGFLPGIVSNMVVNIIISFVASLQVSSFRKLVDSPYATTMCTGNLRSASEAALTAFIKKDKKSAITSSRYFLIIVTFLLGAFIGGILTTKIGNRAVWGAAFILIFSFLLLLFMERESE